MLLFLWKLQQLLRLIEACYGNFPKLRLIFPIFVVNVHLYDVVLLPGENTAVQLRHALAQVKLSGMPLSQNLLKLLVLPDHPPVIQKHGIRHGQLPEQRILHHTILDGELDQIFHNKRLAVKIQNRGHKNVDRYEQEH